MTINEARSSIGRRVIHRPDQGRPREGRILSVGSWKAFVSFGGGALSKPVDPANLELAEAVTR